MPYMKKLFIQVLPFLVSLTMGMLIYLFGVDQIKDEGLSNLVVNVASGLVSIPLVFIFYDVINKITSRDLHNTLFESITFDINTVLVDFITMLEDMLGMSHDVSSKTLEDFFDMTSTEILRKLKINKEYASKFSDLKDQLNDIIHKPSAFEILSESQIRALLSISKEMSVLSKNIESESTNGKRNAMRDRHIAQSVERISDALSVWVESGKKDALQNHAHFNFGMENAQAPVTSATPSPVTKK